MKRIIFALSCAIALQGCATTKVYFDQSTPSNAEVVQKNVSHYFWHAEEVDAIRECGGRKVYKVVSNMGLFDALISGITFNALAGQTLTIYCEPKSGS